MDMKINKSIFQQIIKLLLPVITILITHKCFAIQNTSASNILQKQLNYFEINEGQFRQNIQFIKRDGMKTLAMKNGCLYYHSDVKTTGIPELSLCFSNSRDDYTIEGKNPYETTINYIPDTNSREWKKNITPYDSVILNNIYNGIDVHLYTNQKNKNLEFDYIIKPGASSESISLTAKNHNQLKLDDDGALHINHDLGEMILSAPYSYQLINNKKITIDSRLVIKDNNNIQIAIGDYNKNHPLIVDPVITFSSFVGGNQVDSSFSAQTDLDNNIYIAGYTNSTNLPVTSAYQNQLGGFASAFVAKFSPAPDSLPIYITYVGNDVAEVRDMAIDPSGNTYVTGSTSSTSFPTVNAFQASKVGIIDGYVFKLNSTGTDLIYSTYFGGNSVDRGRAIGLDSQNNAYITGVTTSTTFPVVNAYQSTNAGVQDAYVIKVSADGGAIIYSTYLGGTGGDYAAAIDVDDSGKAYLSGNTSSTDYPLMNADQNQANGGEDGIVSVMDSSGGLLYSSYLGGNNNDFATSIKLDNNGNILVAGNTESTNFPFLMNNSQPLNGVRDAFITRIDPSAINVPQSQLKGGSGEDSAQAMVVDNNNDIYISGVTTSNDLDLILPVQPTNAGGNSEIFINVLSMDDGISKFSTYLGGSGEDYVRGLSITDQFDLLLSGETSSNDYPLSNAFQTTLSGTAEAIISVIDLDNDNDLVADFNDNCPATYNPLQLDDDNNGTGNLCEPPVISGFWPTTASPGEFIFIFGSGFQAQSTQASVNGIDAPLLQVVSPEMLIFALPSGNTTGQIQVTTTVGTTSSSTDFGLTSAGLTLSGIWPANNINTGDFIFVFGSGFISPLSVNIGATPVPIVQLVSESMLIFMLPVGASSAPVSVTSQGETVTSTINLIINSN